MAVKGAVLGDILGSQYEFTRPKDLDWINTPLISDYPLEFTDDTVMTLAIKKALTKGTDLIETMVDVGRKYPHCGYGGTFYRWINGPIHKPYNSWGNGSAMRTSYIGEVFEDYEKMQGVAAEVASVSHNHPEGIKGAVVTSTCIWMAKHGKSKEEIYEYVLKEYPVEEYEYSIGFSLDEIRPRYVWDVSCQGSVPAAMRCFYESTDYESFMRNIYSLPCDSDTFGAIAGGVAEEYYGGFGNVDADGILKKYLTDELYELLVG
ncbi:MAG: ADP-ribosylglycohydrolase family protein [Pseudobutyrivibrio sp.]|uniref:ADP-ribosylglycohydrolase family protein n=1 Tax=Pseudobutyrivibrio sp. TaxID=2014367 RepID=UPI0025F93882|nr:ADP-ribosylglycohydrolase family protein [Pseudobutyrivibrio sp.]MBQ6462803.1 ADP-ribosylglycohydrolase family protein [Pseudobutyrivibrio sp.]